MVHWTSRIHPLEDGGVGAGERRQSEPIPWGKRTEGGCREPAAGQGVSRTAHIR